MKLAGNILRKSVEEITKIINETLTKRNKAHREAKSKVERPGP